ncbi:hypothetical protein GCM10017790_01590 [Amycolatopsis oliviviridis]|uniref:Metallo-beta-lactamase domain-containing protein n=1 Tax=Amycolatopsis oliviviridis TaxID=1471590 RepID=A0ABQ3L8H2_9PSEU|nr:hypothetical protein GCM10017790_01590 [Amycolatopsis oliviviridis]
MVFSHADNDHVGGASQLLSDDRVSIDKVWLNTDVKKTTKKFIDLLHQLNNLVRAKKIKLSVNLNSAASGDLDFGRVSIEVIHPSVSRAIAGQATAKGHPMGEMTTNGMSAVIRVLLADRPCVLLAGDVDSAGFNEIANEETVLNADVLVFPHHGGHAYGPSDEDFASRFTRSVDPKVVVFSMGRDISYKNPDLNILRGVRRAAPKAHITCTQLSKHCQVEDITPGSSEAGEVAGWPSLAKSKTLCCAGTVLVDMTDGKFTYTPNRDEHHKFINRRIEDPQCATET